MRELKTPEEFKDFTSNQFALVMFCEDHCHACWEFEREMDNRASDAKREVPFLTCAKIDCAVVPDVTKNMLFVPVIKLYYNGRGYGVADGCVTYPALRDWVLKFIKNNKLEVN